MPTTNKTDDTDLDLPALDGEEDDVEAPAETLDTEEDDGGNPFDDATGEGDAYELAVDGAEGGWLVDAETAGGLDVGTFDVAIEPEGRVLDDAEADDSSRGLDDLVADPETFVADGGEEGPLADDEELREEDLPALDADEDGDVPEDALFDRAALAVDDELRWDDRAWARLPEGLATPTRGDEPDDSGILAMPGEDAASPRDVAWKSLEETGRAMVAAFVPGGSVVVALATPDRTRALLVRIRPDGEVRIIAEVDPRQGQVAAGSPTETSDDDEPVCVVTFVRWDTPRGCLVVGGNFGVEAYRPTA